MNTKLSILSAVALGMLVTLNVNARPGGRVRHGGGDSTPGANSAHVHQTPNDNDPGVNHHQENQHDRIAQGVHSGQLTKEEAKDLASTQKEIRKEEAQYKSDGKLTADERKDLHQDLKAASKDICQEKHDAETQPGMTPATRKSLGTKDPSINARQEFQKERIKEGVESGELTKGEAHTLAQKERHLAHLEKKLKEDGTLTPEERMRLERLQNKLSKDIHSQKHDDQGTGTTTE